MLYLPHLPQKIMLWTNQNIQEIAIVKSAAFGVKGILLPLAQPIFRKYIYKYCQKWKGSYENGLSKISYESRINESEGDRII